MPKPNAQIKFRCGYAFVRSSNLSLKQSSYFNHSYTEISNTQVRRGFLRLTHNGLQLNFSLGFGTVFYRTANNKAKCLLDICKAKINFFRGSDRFCKCRSRMPKLNLGAVSSCQYIINYYNSL